MKNSVYHLEPCSSIYTVLNLYNRIGVEKIPKGIKENTQGHRWQYTIQIYLKYRLDFIMRVTIKYPIE